MIDKLRNFYKINASLVWSFIAVLAVGSLIIWLGGRISKASNDNESTALQVLQLISTAFITYLPTKILAGRQEKKLSENRARMALRRTITLDSQMRQISAQIAVHKLRLAESVDNNEFNASSAVAGIEAIEAMHNMQYGQIQAVAEDWADTLPGNLSNLDKMKEDNNG